MQDSSSWAERPGAPAASLVLLLALALVLAGCSAAPPPKGSYRVMGRTYTVLKSNEGFAQTGTASWYGKKFHGRTTANGETYDMYGRTAAHKELPFGTVVKVTNLENGRTLDVRINDRGPFVHGRIIDLTKTLGNQASIILELVIIRVAHLLQPFGQAVRGEDYLYSIPNISRKLFESCSDVVFQRLQKFGLFIPGVDK